MTTYNLNFSFFVFGGHTLGSIFDDFTNTLAKTFANTSANTFAKTFATGRKPAALLLERGAPLRLRSVLRVFTKSSTNLRGGAHCSILTTIFINIQNI